jgi:methanogenic corrinoid protein MtbC1
MTTIQQQAAQAICQQQNELAENIVARIYEQQSITWKPFGDPGRAKSVRDEGYHLTYLSEALAAGDPALFTAYLGWAKVFFAGLKFREDMLSTTLEATRQGLEEMLPPEFRPAALKYLDIGLNSLAGASSTLKSFIETDNPLADLARSYMDALVRGDRFSASCIVLEAARQGTAIKDIYLHVFQCSQREIGRLWQTNQISVAQEHFSTAVTQLVMSQLYPYIFASEKKGRRLVTTCVGGELHEIGARMVADFFEMDGWDTYFLGANTPLDSILRTVAERQADVLAISATMTFHLGKVTELIAELRRSGLDKRTRVLVGGYPFNIAPNLWQTVGADGYARDAREALIEAERILQP